MNRKTRYQPFAIVLGILSSLGVAHLTHAQGPEQGTAGSPSTTAQLTNDAPVPAASAKNAQIGKDAGIRSIAGVLAAVTGNRIKIQAEDNSEYFAVVTPKSHIKYSSATKARFLRPGYTVRLEAEFDPNSGFSVAPAGELELFRPIPKEEQNLEAQPTPGINLIPQNATAQANNLADPASVPKRRFLIVGQLRVIQPTQVQILVGDRPFLVDIGKETTISMTAGDSMFCLPGDEVKLIGTPSPGQPSLIQVKTLEVTGPVIGSRSTTPQRTANNPFRRAKNDRPGKR